MITKTKKIFCGGLSASTTVEDVKAYFEQFGKVIWLFYLCMRSSSCQANARHNAELSSRLPAPHNLNMAILSVWIVWSVMHKSTQRARVADPMSVWCQHQTNIGSASPFWRGAWSSVDIFHRKSRISFSRAIVFQRDILDLGISSWWDDDSMSLCSTVWFEINRNLWQKNVYKYGGIWVGYTKVRSESWIGFPCLWALVVHTKIYIENSFLRIVVILRIIIHIEWRSNSTVLCLYVTIFVWLTRVSFVFRPCRSLWIVTGRLWTVLGAGHWSITQMYDRIWQGHTGEIQKLDAAPEDSEISSAHHWPANNRHSPDAVSMLSQRWRR